MELKGNGGHNNSYTEINIAHVDNVNPNVKEVANTIYVGKKKIVSADKSISEDIIKHLKRVENDYGIDLTTEISWLNDKVKLNK